MTSTPPPDTTRLRELPVDAWRALGRRLKAIGYTGPASRPVRELVPPGASAARAPMAKWHARRVREPWGAALRMLLMSDPVTEAEAQAALGDEVGLERLLAVGLLVRTAAGAVCSPYRMTPAGDAVFLCEELWAGGETVMGPGGTTLQLVRAAYPAHAMGAALDVGCGAGTAGILLARRFDRVVATDISARAIDVARVNGALNEVGNVEFRVGDMFAPVTGETFDLVVSQPPFIARPDDSPDATFLFGGARGDELPMRFVREVEPHLAPGGVAIAVIEWPVVDGDAPLDERLRQAVGTSASLHVLHGKGSVDENCAQYATLMHPTLDDAWERAALQRRDHFEKLRVRAMRPSFTILRRPAEGARGWTVTEESDRVGKASVTRAELDARAAAFDLAQQGPEALRAARLRVPEGVTFSEQGGRFEASFGAQSLRDPVELGAATLRLVEDVHEGETVGEAVDRAVAAAGARESADALLTRVQQMLIHGVLEVDADPA